MINLNLREKRQQLFNPSIDSFIKSFFDNEWIVYNNTNLSIHITDKCNADCAFCIAHLRYLNEGLVYLKPEIEEDSKYYERLNNILLLTKHINPSVSLTGGEPTVNRKLPTILKILSSHNVRKRTITTNGTGLFYKIPDSNHTILDALSDYKLEHLNISRAHKDSKINSKIMVMAEHLMPDGRLEEIVQEAKIKGIKTRLSCALLKNGVSAFKDIMSYIEWAEKIGVDNVIFRQLMQFDEERVEKGRIPIYCKDEEVDLSPIWKHFDNSPEFEFYHQVLGYYYYVEVRKFNELNVVSESADLRLIKPQLAKYKQQFNTNTAFEMVYHPNGNLCAGWNENEYVMSEYHES